LSQFTLDVCGAPQPKSQKKSPTFTDTPFLGGFKVVYDRRGKYSKKLINSAYASTVDDHVKAACLYLSATAFTPDELISMK